MNEKIKLLLWVLALILSAVLMSIDLSLTSAFGIMIYVTVATSKFEFLEKKEGINEN